MAVDEGGHHVDAGLSRSGGEVQPQPVDQLDDGLVANSNSRRATSMVTVLSSTLSP
jgi:hypothetical protein